jgi:hypothetical protein
MIGCRCRLRVEATRAISPINSWFGLLQRQQFARTIGTFDVLDSRAHSIRRWTMKRASWVKGVASMAVIVLLGSSTVPVVAAAPVISSVAKKGSTVGEDDAGDFIGAIAKAALACAIGGAIEGSGGLPVGMEAGAILGFYAGALSTAFYYWMGDDRLTRGPMAQLPKTVLD